MRIGRRYAVSVSIHGSLLKWAHAILKSFFESEKVRQGWSVAGICGLTWMVLSVMENIVGRSLTTVKQGNVLLGAFTSEGDIFALG